MPQQARASLEKARDEYATRGDFNRVVAIDRTLGWLAFRDNDENGALEALERSLALIKVWLRSPWVQVRPSVYAIDLRLIRSRSTARTHHARRMGSC